MLEKHCGACKDRTWQLTGHGVRERERCCLPRGLSVSEQEGSVALTAVSGGQESRWCAWVHM